jgi:hypothetical protein
MRAKNARIALNTLILGLFSLSVACGPGYLTPEEVRRHLEAPSGQISANTIGFATDDFFKAQKASAAEGTANFIKSSESDGGAAAWAAGVIESGNMEKAVAMGAIDDIGDLFCAAGLVASIASFDSCQADSSNCEAELVIDSCILRIGEGGDELARGKLLFRIRTEQNDDFERSELRIEFEDFETTENADEELTRYFGGILAIETTSSDERDEIIMSCDLKNELRNQDRGLFNDGVVEGERLSVALRFLAERDEDSSSGSLEILAFLDDTDDSRDESVVLSFAAESRRIDEDTSIAGATLSVRGSNGDFECTWTSARERVSAETSTYESAGNCIDNETGETFDWESSASSTQN